MTFRPHDLGVIISGTSISNSFPILTIVLCPIDGFTLLIIP